MIDHFETCNVQTTVRCTCPGDTERIEAAIRLLYPDEMTPTARNVLLRILEEETDTATRQKFYGWGEQKVSF